MFQQLTFKLTDTSCQATQANTHKSSQKQVKVKQKVEIEVENSESK